MPIVLYQRYRQKTREDQVARNGQESSRQDSQNALVEHDLSRADGKVYGTQGGESAVPLVQGEISGSQFIGCEL